MKTNKIYTLFWRHGKTELVEGNDPADAMNKAGYGQGAVRALDFYSEGDKQKLYYWNSNLKEWKPSMLEAQKYTHNLNQQDNISPEDYTNPNQ